MTRSRDDVDDDQAGPGSAANDRTATVRTVHDDPALVDGALAPDNTDSMDTRVLPDDGTVVCEIRRPTTGGLQSTVDDYVVNLAVADRVVARGRAHRTGVTTDNAGPSDPDTPEASDAAETPGVFDANETDEASDACETDEASDACETDEASDARNTTNTRDTHHE